jgi:hypothetical protein
VYLQKGGNIGYDGNKKVNGIKISSVTENTGLPIALYISSANIHDSRLDIPTVQGVKIKLDVGGPIARPKRINADRAYDSRELRD